MHSEACKYDDVYQNFKENVFHCLGESKERRNLKGIDLVSLDLLCKIYSFCVYILL